ncbi:hypothetical protein [Yersinia intermedia]|uniref:Single-stranded DNA-binding protein n=1 Tax=Yersinia intermedia TaxID=631 RepID=A0A209A5U8_YERIN|nr:hypothetical protein [Yersinia intermedia]OVZ88149.1 hypothetical protein CBW57_06390 [Yersinia intermedia]
MDTFTGRLAKAPKRVQSSTGKVMAVATILASSDKRSDYPLRVIAFDMLALELMLCQLGQKVTVSGRSAYWNGYQVTVSSLIYNCQEGEPTGN